MIRQRESLTIHTSSQIHDETQITFGDAPLLQSRLPIPLHMIPNADCYVGRGGRLCYGTPTESDSSDSDSGGECPLLRSARRTREDQPEVSSSHDHVLSNAAEMNTGNAEAQVSATSGPPAAVDPLDIIMADAQDAVPHTISQVVAVDPPDIIIISDDEEDVAGTSAQATAVDIIIISDDEDERSGLSGQANAVDPPGIIIISDEEDEWPSSSEQLAAVEPSRSIIVSNGEEIISRAGDIGQDYSARQGDTIVISNDDVVNSAADEPTQVLTADTPEIMHHAEAEELGTPMPRSQDVCAELLRALDRLTLSEYRMVQHRRLPFLRRNLRRGFFIRCEQFGRDVTPAACLDGHIAVDFKYYLLPGPYRERGPCQIYHGCMIDWRCPLCNTHAPFPNQEVLSFHLERDHPQMMFMWTDNGQHSVSYLGAQSVMVSLMRL